MRIASLLFAFIVLGALVGCGKDGPSQPAAMTPEEEKKFEDEEKNIADEEQRHRAERRTNAPVTSEQ